jgi:glucose/arabinose dehydrogenase
MKIILTLLALASPTFAAPPAQMGRGQQRATFQNAFPNLHFSGPVFLTHAPDKSNRLFVVEQQGVIRVFQNAATASASTIFADFRPQVIAGGEEGLLGLAFDPNFATNGYFYVFFSSVTTGPTVRKSNIVRVKVSNADPNVADMSTQTLLLSYEKPFSNHNGGMLAFGPDGMLYVSTGDGGSGGDPYNNAQNLNSYLGKILRLDPAGASLVPSDNPFAGTANAKGEIWAYGLRNVWRFSFDRKTGTLWAGDVGQGAVEEIDLVSKGGNFGWRVYEGNQSYNNPTGIPASQFIAPLYTYPHGALGNCIIGGYVYGGSQVPTQAGRYIYGDNGSGKIWSFMQRADRTVDNQLIGSLGGLTSFGEDADGEVYALTYSGTIYRMVSSLIH